MNRTIVEAKKTNCPLFSFRNRNIGWVSCIANECTAWEVAHREETREDHSGADMFMMERAAQTARQVRREGPTGCMGRWILDETGYCALIEKREVVK